MVDYIVEEDSDWDTYVAIILCRGIRAVIEDLTPSENTLLQRTLMSMYAQNPEFVSRFIVDTLKAGESPEEIRQEAKHKLGFIKD